MRADEEYARGRYWCAPVRVEDGWVRVKLACCAQEMQVSLPVLEDMGALGLKIAHCNRGFTLVWGPFKRAAGDDAVLWMEWTPSAEVLRPAP